MTSDGVGYWSESNSISPSNGLEFRLHRTADDWNNTVNVMSGGGGLGCCFIGILEAISSNSILFTHNDQGYRVLRTGSFINGAWQEKNLYPSLQYPQLYDALSDTSAVIVAYSLDTTWVSIATPNTLTTIDAISNADSVFVRKIAFYNADIGAELNEHLPNGSELRVTNNNGSSWHTTPLSNSTEIRDMKWLGPSTLWLVGDNGLIIRTNETGSIMDTIPSSTSADLYSVSGYSEDSVWVGGSAGTVLATGNAGVSWTSLPVGDSLVFRIQTFDGAVYAYIREQGQYAPYHRLYKYSRPRKISFEAGSWSSTTEGVLLHIEVGATIQTLEMFDQFGRQVNVFGPSTALDLRHLAAGAYFIKWRSDLSQGTTKVVWPGN